MASDEQSVAAKGGKKGYSKGPGFSSQVQSKGPGLPSKGGKGGPSWREKAAAAAAEAALARETFQKLRVASLPPGAIDSPRWDTAFAVEFPDAGQTQGVLFLATLDGSYVLKSSKVPAQEYFATKFMQQLGIPAPETRVIFGKDAEHSMIREALMTVAGQLDRRGDLEDAHRILMRVHSGFMPSMPVLLMSLVPGAIPLGSASASQVEQLLDVSEATGDRPAAAVARLRAAGRCWLADALMGFRDRFASPVTCREYQKLRAMLEEHGPEILQEGPPPTLFDQYGMLQGNADNLLLTDAVPPATGGLVAIDNHVQHVSSTNERSCGMEPQAVAGIFAAVLEEVARDGLLEPPAASVEFFQHMVRQITGHVLSTAALCEFRLGVLYALRDSADSLRWAKSFLAELQDAAEATESKFWLENVRYIDGQALQLLGAAVCAAVGPHAALLASLPEALPAMQPAAAARPAAASCEALGADPALWAALSPELQAALQRDPPRPIPWVPK